MKERPGPLDDGSFCTAKVWAVNLFSRVPQGGLWLLYQCNYALRGNNQTFFFFCSDRILALLNWHIDDIVLIGSGEHEVGITLDVLACVSEGGNKSQKYSGTLHLK